MDQINTKMIKKTILLLLLICPVLAMAQGHKGSVESCAPMKEGKVCYSDEVDVEGVKKGELFKAIDKWAKKNYGKDVFLSSVNSSKSKGTIFINSKVELLLNDTDKTIVKYKMRIYCHDEKYNVELTDISYQYDPNNEKKYKTYPAENVIANNGKSNTIALIKDPLLFCNVKNKQTIYINVRGFRQGVPLFYSSRLR